LTRPGSRYSYRRLDVRHPLDSAHGSIISDQARGMLQYELKANEVAARGHTMRGEFLHIDGLEKIQQDVHREDIRLDCMATAVCIGAWSMLTWRSRWLDGLSSCRIVQAHFGDGETWPAFAPDSCSPVSNHSYSPWLGSYSDATDRIAALLAIPRTDPTCSWLSYSQN
jgi:hypothetical protein